jgi:hypothetical protein
MLESRQRPTLIYAGISVALLFWLLETLLHYWIFDPDHGLEWWPHDQNEIWMRSLIFLLLIGFSIYGNYVSTKKIKIEQEKFATFKATMNTVMDIEGNFLNNLALFQMELEDTHTLSEKSMDEIEYLIRNTHERLNVLASAREIKQDIVAGTIPIIQVNKD